MRQVALVAASRCGPARHAIQLASLGLHGHALDSEPAMLEHARARSQAAGADVQCIVGDMRDFSLPVGATERSVTVSAAQMRVSPAASAHV